MSTEETYSCTIRKVYNVDTKYSFCSEYSLFTKCGKIRTVTRNTSYKRILVFYAAVFSRSLELVLCAKYLVFIQSLKVIVSNLYS